MPTKLTDHITEEELTFSQTATRKGIDNSPSPAARENLVLVAGALEEVRTLLGDVPILVSSGYRSPELNTAVGGAKNSAHLKGLAADFTAPAFGSVIEVAQKIAASGIQYDQLIYEYGTWVHIGLPGEGAAPRRQDLSIFPGTGYFEGIRQSPA